MIDPAAIRDIIEMYRKHGWAFRRVLLSGDISVNVDTFSGVEVAESDIDALWFSRPSPYGGTAWELRHLGSAPLAFVTVIANDASDAEDRIADTEQRLRDALEGRKSGGTPTA
jgi:hypothetical protein